MKDYLITFEWTIKHTKKGFSRTGVSTYKVSGYTKVNAINKVIECAENMPSWELERNNIDEKQFREGCILLYETRLKRILAISTKVNA